MKTLHTYRDLLYSFKLRNGLAISTNQAWAWVRKNFSCTMCIAAAPVLDGGGECGSITHYVFILTLVGSAFLIFLYLWRKGKLDMDEEPKHTMMNDEQKDTHQQKPQEKKGDPHV